MSLRTPRAKTSKQIKAREGDQLRLLHWIREWYMPVRMPKWERSDPGKQKKRCSLPFEAVGDRQNPLLGNEDTTANVPAGFSLQGTLPGPPSRATRPTPQNPLVHPGRRAAPTVYQGAGEDRQMWLTAKPNGVPASLLSCTRDHFSPCVNPVRFIHHCYTTNSLTLFSTQKRNLTSAITGLPRFGSKKTA